MRVEQKLYRETVKKMLKDMVDANPQLTPWEKERRKWEVDQAACAADGVCELVEQANKMINGNSQA